MEFESWNSDYINYKTIQFDTLIEIILKGIIWNLPIVYSVNFKEKPNIDSNFWQKWIYWGGEKSFFKTIKHDFLCQ